MLIKPCFPILCRCVCFKLQQSCTSFVDCVYFFETKYMNQDTNNTQHLVQPIVNATKLIMHSFNSWQRLISPQQTQMNFTI